MSNPYEAPQPIEPVSIEPQPAGLDSLGDSNMVKQVPLVAVYMFIQAGLETMMGMMLVAAGPLMFVVLQAGPDGRQPPPGAPDPQAAATVVTIVYVLFGLLCLTAAALKIWAGTRVLKFRSRSLAFVALGSSLLTVLTCYCAPTAVGLAIYGLIVLVHEDVARAFELGQRGYDPARIRATPYRQPVAPNSDKSLS